MKMRRASTGDVPAIQRLYGELDGHHAEILPDVFRPSPGDARPDALVRERIIDPDSACFVAEEGGRVVAFLSMKRSSHPAYPMFRPREFAVIEDAVVEKPRRGRGIGRGLFEAAVAWARELGLEHVQTTVWHANAGARDFYRRLGFDPLTERLEISLRDWPAPEQPRAAPAGEGPICRPSAPRPTSSLPPATRPGPRRSPS